MSGDELHRAEDGFQGAAAALAAEAAGEIAAVERSAGGRKHDRGGRADDAGKIFAVVVERERLVPGTGAVGDATGHEPSSGVDHPGGAGVGEEVVERGEIAKHGVIDKYSVGGIGAKATPAAGGDAVGGGAGQAGDLGGDLVRGQQIVGIQELDKVPAGEAEGVVAGGAGAGVGLRDDPDAVRCEGAGDGDAVVGGAVIDDDDFGAGMGLGQGGREGGCEPRGGVVARDENADEGAHCGTPVGAGQAANGPWW